MRQQTQQQQPMELESNCMWSLGTRNIMVTVSEFAGIPRVHIRQYFNPDSASPQQHLVPTRKGIALTRSEWETLKQHMVQVDRALQDQPPSYCNPATTTHQFQPSCNNLATTTLSDTTVHHK